MSDTTRRLIRMCISALVSGILTALTALLQTLTDTGMVSTKAMWVAIIGGVILMLKDVQSVLSEPPTRPAPVVTIPMPPGAQTDVRVQADTPEPLVTPSGQPLEPGGSRG